MNNFLITNKINFINFITDNYLEFKKFISVYDLRKNKDRYDDILLVINKNIIIFTKMFKISEKCFNFKIFYNK